MPQSDKPRLFVGIGASAGGIEACQTLFEAMPADSGVAFILVLHLDPKRASHLAEVLQTRARHVTITQAEGAERLEANHAYVIAPNSKLQLADGVLEVEPLAENETRGRLVDYLFASIAAAEGERGAGVVLSGAGQDATEGLRRIKAAGGLTIAQDPATAAARSMPESAIDAGVVDAVLAPEAIGQALAAFAEDAERPTTATGSPIRAPLSGFERVLEQLGVLADVDFDDYKIGTLERRTRRRMKLKGIENWSEYATHVADHPEELDALYYDVLIGVTEFFRDPPVWERLAAELPALLEPQSTQNVRAWVAGCGTGEEAYTMAMLLHDWVPIKGRSRIQIYATDLNERALAVARRGIYAFESLQNVNEERRARYFHQRDGHMQIQRSIRDCVTFAPHNVLSDPPFSRMHLVICRNLLIYLKPGAHERLLKRLHFALRTDGLLVLGRAETPGRQIGLFEQVSKQHGLYRARAVPHHERFHPEPRTKARARGTDHAGSSPPAAPRPRAPVARPDRRVEQYVLREHTPACVVINSDFEIRHFYGPTDRYLVPPTGESRQDLLAWIRQGFYVRLRSALKEAVGSGKPLVAEGQIDRDGETRRVECTVEAIPAAVSDGEELFLVTFRDVGASALEKIDATGPPEPLVRELEQELSDTRRELQTTIEQLESAGAEHQATNEELQSLNEELQSSNEELEASKEELEALNEEMNTINRELEEKNAELREVNADLNNLFLSTGIPTIFLDQELRIRRFTSAATELLRLVPSDVGRSIEHIKERFDNGQTAAKSRQVLETMQPDSTEVGIADGRWYVRKILPYQSDDHTEGVCITFADVTEQKRVAEASEAARVYSETIIETVRSPLLVLDEALRVVSVNQAFRVAFGSGEELVGERLSDARDRRWNVPELDDILKVVLSGGADVNDYEITSQERIILVNARRVEREDITNGILLSFEDVTAHREAQRQAERHAVELEQGARRKDQWIAMLGHELRNPVGAIRNGIEILKSLSSTPEARARVVAMMDRQVHHVAAHLDDLLDAGRIISGKVEIERDAVDLAEVGAWAVDNVRRLIDEKGHQLAVRLPAKNQVWVQGDRLRLTEVLMNLLTNAAKYTDPGGHITLEITAAERAAIVSVRDTGMGIPAEIKDAIFDMFTQGPRPRGRSEPGLGLGLALVRTLVELHGGKIEVFSRGKDEGSEFRVELPRIEHASSEPAQPDEGATSHPATPRRILIVDDERDAAESLAQLLRAAGHETRIARDAGTASEVARSFEPEVALLDLGLPGIDGYTVARQLRDEFPDVLSVAVTGYQRDEERLRAAGFDHHLIKPVAIKQLTRLLAARREGSPVAEP